MLSACFLVFSTGSKHLHSAISSVLGAAFTAGRTRSGVVNANVVMVVLAIIWDRAAGRQVTSALTKSLNICFNHGAAMPRGFYCVDGLGIDGK